MSELRISESEGEDDVPLNLNKDGMRERRRKQDEERRKNEVNTPNSITSGAHGWQSALATMADRLRVLLGNSLMADITFIVGPERVKIPGHKFILSVSSSVFEAMFFSKLATTASMIEVPDIESSAFRNLLAYIYLDTASIKPDNVMTTLYAAKKYAVPKLEKMCVEFLECNLCSENAFLLLCQARLFDEEQLAANCLDVIDKKTLDSIESEAFLDTDYETLYAVLQRDTLRIREIRLYEAVVRWAEFQCRKKNLEVTKENQQTVLSDCIKLIRYPLMTVEEFASGPAQNGLLVDAQIVQLFLHFTLNPKPETEFIDIPRCCMMGRECVATRFGDVESRWGYNGTSDRIRFQVDKRIFMAGLGLYGSVYEPSEYEVTIQIVHSHSTKVVGYNRTWFTADGTSKPIRVMFKEPVEIMPNSSYIAIATLKGHDSYYGTKGMRKLILQCSKGERITFQFSYAAGNNNGSSVEDGQIPEFIFYT